MLAGENSGMAKSDNRKRGEIPEPPRWSNEVVGIVLICAGLLAFLSVISFTASDLPADWANWNEIFGKNNHNMI